MKLLREILVLILALGFPVGARADHLLAPRLVLGGAPVTDEDRARASDLARKAIGLLERHNLIDAEDCLRQALAIVPDKAVWHFNLACVLTAEAKPDAAMESLERATELGFTDFTTLEFAPALKPLHALPRYQALLARKNEITHKAAMLAMAQLRRRFGDGYLYEVDDERKLIFATNTDQATLDALKLRLGAQAKSQGDDLFAHKPDEFIRVVVPSSADYHRLIRRPGVHGLYDDELRTLVAEQMGQVMTHEFTHALHAADQRALGQEHPIWLREGLASMYEAAEFENDRLIPHDNYRLGFVHQAALRKGLIPFEKLLKLRYQDFFAAPNLAYGETSSLMLYLYEHQLLRKFYDAYTASYSSDPTGKAALESVTGMSLGDLEKTWTEWMLARKVPPIASGPGGPDLGVHFGAAVDGLKVFLVVPGGAAAKASLKPGDVIVGMDSHETRDYASYCTVLTSHKVGDEVSVKVRRDGKYLDVPVVLGKR